ncbi:hypothetical protein FIU28_17020 [Tardiphaga sp. vice154]|uniref:hypothetical protein n=1 Tax=Tardiphaga sp. vice154 TaxID=2592814 RepID=UPI0011624E49|nr:hypothetical protein [Tardiphaga sp. vice154]QDM22662.1 hypothetical protein FIU28_17020 [Tardiphaga sp. vice154]
MHIIEVEVVVKIRTSHNTTRPLYVAVNGAGAAQAVVGVLDVAFSISPAPAADESVWVLLARIASEGARAQAEKFG